MFRWEKHRIETFASTNSQSFEIRLRKIKENIGIRKLEVEIEQKFPSNSLRLHVSG